MPVSACGSSPVISRGSTTVSSFEYKQHAVSSFSVLGTGSCQCVRCTQLITWQIFVSLRFCQCLFLGPVAELTFSENVGIMHTFSRLFLSFFLPSCQIFHTAPFNLIGNYGFQCLLNNVDFFIHFKDTVC